MDQHALDRLEFGRVTAAMASHAESEAGQQAVLATGPISEPHLRERECQLLAEALRRTRDPGDWVWTGTGSLAARLDADAMGDHDALDGVGLVAVTGWLEAAARTGAEWSEVDRVAGFPALAAHARVLPRCDALRASLQAALEPDGRVSDRASIVLARSRRGLADGERQLLERLERWVRPFGSEAYVTRHG